MTESKRDNIKLKIQALLSKTVENGATEQEANTALKMANKLMTAYYIEESELSSPFENEKCISEEVPLIKSGYDITLFWAHLCRLFDCFHAYGSDYIVFFGFKQDVQLASYFYRLITKACLNEKDKYLRSREYRSLRARYSGRTLASSFIKGFLIEIIRKMDAMYENRKSTIPEGMGLILFDKNKKVKEQFENAFNPKEAKPRKLTAEREAFLTGREKGEDFKITQAISTTQKKNTLQLIQS